MHVWVNAYTYIYGRIPTYQLFFIRYTKNENHAMGIRHISFIPSNTLLFIEERTLI